ncbi:hypothetical protein ACK14O_14435 [Vibrio harveyi]|uniref:hypothetical protein n=1 Tax=Vibrio harveyi TaxID=669 RepID=UPI00390A7647
MDIEHNKEIARNLRVAIQLMECESLDNDARSFIQHTAAEAAEMIDVEESQGNVHNL